MSSRPPRARRARACAARSAPRCCSSFRPSRSRRRTTSPRPSERVRAARGAGLIRRRARARTPRGPPIANPFAPLRARWAPLRALADKEQRFIGASVDSYDSLHAHVNSFIVASWAVVCGIAGVFLVDWGVDLQQWVMPFSSTVLSAALVCGWLPYETISGILCARASRRTALRAAGGGRRPAAARAPAQRAPTASARPSRAHAQVRARRAPVRHWRPHHDHRPWPAERRDRRPDCLRDPPDVNARHPLEWRAADDHEPHHAQARRDQHEPIGPLPHHTPHRAARPRARRQDLRDRRRSARLR